MYIHECNCRVLIDEEAIERERERERGSKGRESQKHLKLCNITIYCPFLYISTNHADIQYCFSRSCQSFGLAKRPGGGAKCLEKGQYVEMLVFFAHISLHPHSMSVDDLVVFLV